MNKILLCLFFPAILLLGGCHNDESYNNESPRPGETRSLQLALTSRIGTAVGDSLTKYVKSLNLLLFRENSDGKFVLYRSKLLTQNQLEALVDAGTGTDAGFTAYKELTFDSLPIAVYQVVGVGNIEDSTGAAQSAVLLSGAVPGNEMTQILASIQESYQSPRLFLGVSPTVQLGGAATEKPVLRLYRKVSMFSLVLKGIPNVVERINMDIFNTSSSFDMAGNYYGSDRFIVLATNNYTVQPGDSVNLVYVTLPTVAGGSTEFTASFFLLGGSKQVIDLPRYVLKPNTITKVTATIDVNQPGNIWKLDLSTLITVNVEWNVDQEPPITI